MNLAVLSLAFAAGLGLGAVYLLGLWWTVKRVTRTGNARLLLVSFFARAALVLLAFYGLMRLGPQGLVASLLGFLCARWLATHLTTRREERDDAVA